MEKKHEKVEKYSDWEAIMKKSLMSYQWMAFSWETSRVILERWLNILLQKGT
jgi:hypothetical protein